MTTYVTWPREKDQSDGINCITTHRNRFIDRALSAARNHLVKAIDVELRRLRFCVFFPCRDLVY